MKFTGVVMAVINCVGMQESIAVVVAILLGLTIVFMGLKVASFKLLGMEKVNDLSTTESLQAVSQADYYGLLRS